MRVSPANQHKKPPRLAATKSHNLARLPASATAAQKPPRAAYQMIAAATAYVMRFCSTGEMPPLPRAAGETASLARPACTATVLDTGATEPFPRSDETSASLARPAGTSRLSEAEILRVTIEW